jgi:uncharacterized damage-inducible protein DinB
MINLKNEFMLIDTLQKLFTRDLNKLKAEIELYQDEKNIWRTDKAIMNSAGNLCLHLMGNLNAYIGAELGKTGYTRHRDLEFSLKNIPRHELVKSIDDTIIVVNQSLEKIRGADLEQEYPVKVFDYKMSTEYFLVHLSSHFTYHLGQVNYHRRLLDMQ